MWLCCTLSLELTSWSNIHSIFFRSVLELFSIRNPRACLDPVFAAVNSASGHFWRGTSSTPTCPRTPTTVPWAAFPSALKRPRSFKISCSASSGSQECTSSKQWPNATPHAVTFPTNKPFIVEGFSCLVTVRTLHFFTNTFKNNSEVIEKIQATGGIRTLGLQNQCRMLYHLSQPSPFRCEKLIKSPGVFRHPSWLV